MTELSLAERVERLERAVGVGSRPVDAGVDKLATASRQADKAWRDAEKKIAMREKPDCVPDGARWDWATDGLGRRVAIWGGDDVRVQDPESDTPFTWRYDEEADWDRPEWSNVLTPALADQCRAFWDAGREQTRETETDADETPEEPDTTQETEPGEALEMLEALRVFGVSEDSAGEISNIYYALREERARNAKRVEELREKARVICPHCDGSGEGYMNGHIQEHCHDCDGSGAMPVHNRIAELESALDETHTKLSESIERGDRLEAESIFRATL